MDWAMEMTCYVRGTLKWCVTFGVSVQRPRIRSSNDKINIVVVVAVAVYFFFVGTLSLLSHFRSLAHEILNFEFGILLSFASSKIEKRKKQIGSMDTVVVDRNATEKTPQSVNENIYIITRSRRK